MENIIEVTYNKIWKTKGARFNSHHNYLKQSRLSTFTVGVLASYVIILSFLFISPSLSFKIGQQGDLNLLVLAASIIVLVFSQIEASKDYKLKAEIMHRNAMELSSLYDEIQNVYYSKDNETIKISQAENILKRYNNTIQKCGENHNEYDYDEFILQHYEKMKISKKWYSLVYGKVIIFFKIRLYFYLWLIVPLLLFYLICVIK